jgi:transposase
MRRVIGMDIHRTFAEVVFWEEGRLRPAGRVSMTRSGRSRFSVSPTIAGGPGTAGSS